MAVMDTDNIIATLESHANLNGSKVAFEYLGVNRVVSSLLRIKI